MGVFTEQVQRLATEQETLRKEREEKRVLKNKQDEAERELYYRIENIFTCTTFTRKNIFKKFENKKDIYNFLKEYDIKNYLIERTTKNVDIQYYLDKKYLSIVKKIYMPYKEKEKEIEEQRKEKEKEIKEEEKAPTNLEIILSLIKCVLLIFFFPILFFIMLFYYLLK